jgi:VIT1/CCC1 family predicted Fe2+/Mn2+ transporter
MERRPAISDARLSALGSLVQRLRGRQWRIVPHPGPTVGEQRVGGKSGALRAAIFGANDGLVSNVSLIMGVTGAGQENTVVILAGVAGLLAGAFSMAAGEYVSMRVQREVFERLIHLEAHELAEDPEAEERELTQIYVSKGISPDLAARVSEELMRDPATALETHAREELGLDPEEGLGSPWAAAGSSFATFSLGALLPLVPFLFGSGTAAVLVSAGLALAALFGIGGGMSLLTGRSFVRSAIRMTLIGGTAAAITFGVGKALDAGVGL